MGYHTNFWQLPVIVNPNSIHSLLSGLDEMQLLDEGAVA